MKIAYIHTGEWPSKSPSMTFATFNCIGLSKEVDRIHFFVKRNSPESSEFVFMNTFNVKKPDQLIMHQFEKSFINTNYFYYKRVYKTIMELHEKNNFDAVITRSLTFLKFLVKLKRKLNIPVFYESHDFYADLSVRHDITIKRKKKHQRIERKYIPQISALICLQKAQKKWYQKVFPDIDIFIGRTGFHKFYKSSKKKKYVTYIGSFDKKKGITVFIEALKYTQTDPLVLLIGGKNEDEINWIKTEVKKHYSIDKVTITGWLNKKQVQDYLFQTKIGIVPLIDTFFNRYLTSPLKLFDYYSYGIPVIASKLPTSSELIKSGKTGILIEPDNPIELAKTIDHLLMNNEIVENMTNYIFKHCHKFLWSHRAKQIVKKIESYQV